MTTIMPTAQAVRILDATMVYVDLNTYDCLPWPSDEVKQAASAFSSTKYTARVPPRASANLGASSVF